MRTCSPYRYALERTSTFIKVWYWPRNAYNIPSDVWNGANSVNTDAWGTPTAYFPNDRCDINGKFAPSNIIINLTFCEFRLAASVLSSEGADLC